MKTINHILGDPIPFLHKVEKFLWESGILLDNFTIDHICYRTTSIDSYDNLKESLSSFGELLIEAMINGRPIATYRLYSPFFYKDHSISILELPSPKPGKSYLEWYEHIECILDRDFETFTSNFPWLKFDFSWVHEGLHPNISLHFEDFAIKFPHTSLESIIEVEKKMGMAI